MKHLLTTTAFFAALLCAGCASVTTSADAQTDVSASSFPDQTEAMKALLKYAKKQNTTGLLIIQDGQILVEENWSAPETRNFGIFNYGPTEDGALFEDVASQQKSFIAVLVGIAVDKGLIDVEKPVSDYLGVGWSMASPEQEQQIKVLNVLEMNTGLDDKFAYTAAAGTKFHYNTPVYATTKDILAAASNLPLDQMTRDWLVVPSGMIETAWRQRPAELANIGNSTGLVTTPRDTARFGQMLLNGGIGSDGTRVISEASLKAMFEPTQTNPAYGRLWWLNGSEYTMVALIGRKEGPLVPAAADDMVAALGFLDRKLYIVPSQNLIVVRMGGDAPEKGFDNQLWMLINRALGL